MGKERGEMEVLSTAKTRTQSSLLLFRLLCHQTPHLMPRQASSHVMHGPLLPGTLHLPSRCGGSPGRRVQAPERQVGGPRGASPRTHRPCSSPRAHGLASGATPQARDWCPREQCPEASLPAA